MTHDMAGHQSMRAHRLTASPSIDPSDIHRTSGDPFGDPFGHSNGNDLVVLCKTLVWGHGGSAFRLFNIYNRGPGCLGYSGDPSNSLEMSLDPPTCKITFSQGMWIHRVN